MTTSKWNGFENYVRHTQEKLQKLGRSWSSYWKVSKPKWQQSWLEMPVLFSWSNCCHHPTLSQMTILQLINKIIHHGLVSFFILLTMIIDWNFLLRRFHDYNALYVHQNEPCRTIWNQLKSVITADQTYSDYAQHDILNFTLFVQQLNDFNLSWQLHIGLGTPNPY